MQVFGDAGESGEAISDEGNSINKSSQTDPSLSQNTPRKRKLRKLIKKKRLQITSLSTNVSNNSSPSKKLTKTQKADKAFKLLEGSISPDFLSFIQKQVALSLKKKKGGDV